MKTMAEWQWFYRAALAFRARRGGVGYLALTIRNGQPELWR